MVNQVNASNQNLVLNKQVAKASSTIHMGENVEINKQLLVPPSNHDESVNSSVLPFDQSIQKERNIKVL